MIDREKIDRPKRYQELLSKLICQFSWLLVILSLGLSGETNQQPTFSPQKIPDLYLLIFKEPFKLREPFDLSEAVWAHAANTTIEAKNAMMNPLVKYVEVDVLLSSTDGHLYLSHANNKDRTSFTLAELLSLGLSMNALTPKADLTTIKLDVKTTPGIDKLKTWTAIYQQLIGYPYPVILDLNFQSRHSALLLKTALELYQNYKPQIPGLILSFDWQAEMMTDSSLIEQLCGFSDQLILSVSAQHFLVNFDLLSGFWARKPNLIYNLYGNLTWQEKIALDFLIQSQKLGNRLLVDINLQQPVTNVATPTLPLPLLKGLNFGR